MDLQLYQQPVQGTAFAPLSRAVVQDTVVGGRGHQSSYYRPSAPLPHHPLQRRMRLQPQLHRLCHQSRVIRICARGQKGPRSNSVDQACDVRGVISGLKAHSAMSALPPKADMCSALACVRFVP